MGGSLFIASCKKDDAPAATVYYQQQDQMARPAINTVFIDAAAKDSFNTTVPTMQASKFGYKFSNKLAAFGYTSNVLGWDKATFAGALSTDVLNVSTTDATVFGSLTGRGLADDVIDTELTLIFGGATGASNPQLTSDNVGGNDPGSSFSISFPYLAQPH